MFYLENRTNGEMAHKLSKGGHDNRTTNAIERAAAFDTYAKAAEFGQNFNDLWTVVEY